MLAASSQSMPVVNHHYGCLRIFKCASVLLVLVSKLSKVLHFVARAASAAGVLFLMFSSCVLVCLSTFHTLYLWYIASALYLSARLPVCTLKTASQANRIESDEIEKPTEQTTPTTIVMMTINFYIFTFPNVFVLRLPPLYTFLI